MIRLAVLVGLGVLTAEVWWTHPALETRAPQALPLQVCGTPEATPLASGPVEVSDAVPVSLVIQNAGEEERLLCGSTPVAARVALHETRLLDGRRVMIPAPDGIIIPAGETRILESAAGHLMLIGLNTALVQGEAFPLTLRFERAGEVAVTVRVRRRADAAGVEPIPPVVAGDLRISLASAAPAPAGTAECRHAADVSC